MPKLTHREMAAALKRTRADAEVLATLPVFAAGPANRRRLHLEMIQAVLVKLSIGETAAPVQLDREEALILIALLTEAARREL